MPLGPETTKIDRVMALLQGLPFLWLMYEFGFIYGFIYTLIINVFISQVVKRVLKLGIDIETHEEIYNKKYGERHPMYFGVVDKFDAEEFVSEKLRRMCRDEKLKSYIYKVIGHKFWRPVDEAALRSKTGRRKVVTVHDDKTDMNSQELNKFMQGNLDYQFDLNYLLWHIHIFPNYSATQSAVVVQCHGVFCE